MAGGQPTWQPAVVRTIGPLETTYPLNFSATKPLTVVTVDRTAARHGLVVGDVVVKVLFPDGVALDGTTITGHDLASLLAQKPGTYTMTVLSQGGLCQAGERGTTRRDLPWYTYFGKNVTKREILA